MLDYIKANVSKQCDLNEAAAEKIRDLMKGYEDKLKDLDEALKDASDLVNKANSQNGLSAQALKDLQVNPQFRVLIGCENNKFCCFLTWKLENTRNYTALVCSLLRNALRT